MGPGARLVVKLSGGGGGEPLVCGGPLLRYLGYTLNGHLFKSTFCAGGGGGNVTFDV